VSSNINYLSINENYPVAGQDNDTQTLRDNFDTIKTSLRVAGEEITDLQENGARTDDDNNFGLNIISNAVFENVRDQKYDAGAPVTVNSTIDFLNGAYQIYRIGANISIDFLNFPGDPVLTAEPVPVGVGKVTLELSGGTEESVVTVGFSTSSGTVIKKDPNFPSVLELDSTTDPVIIEVWRHSQETIYMRYVGKFE
jgi:hypothetical protein